VKRVTIVEDNEGLGLLLLYKCKRNGWDVNLFDNGYNASEFLRNNTVDLIILDLMVPGVSGWEILEEFTDTDVIVVSARSRDEDLKRAFGYKNVIDYVKKPLYMSTLFEKIDKLNNIKIVNI
jgi:DNA-binding response OmpR family regulator